MKRPLLVLIAFTSIVAFVATSESAFAQTAAGVVVFENKCASCHQSAQAQKAPDVSVLRKIDARGCLRRAFQGASHADPRTLGRR